MLPETSPTAHYEAFIRPAMTADQVTRLIRKVWAEAYAKGFRDSDRGHEILDDPEFVLTEVLKIPLWNDLPQPTAKFLEPFDLTKYTYHYWQAKNMLKRRQMVGKHSQLAPESIPISRPEYWSRKKAINRL